MRTPVSGEPGKRELSRNSTRTIRIHKALGIDLGDRVGSLRRSYGYQASDDDEDDSISSSDYDGEGFDGGAQLALQEKEEALVQSALARIQRAQDRGKKEVKLNKEELAALERRRQRIAEEQARRASASASGSERRQRKEREQRFSIPISQLEASPGSTPRKKKKKGKASPAGSDDSLPRHPMPADIADEHRRQTMPPMGYFPPPNASRSRPRSATSASQRPPSRAMDERVQAPQNYASLPSHRHVSDSFGSRPHSSRSALPPEDAWQSNISPASSRTSSISRSRHSMDPFQFQTEGSRAPYIPGAGASSRRHLSATLDPRRASAVPAAARGERSSRRPSPEESDTTSETSDPDTSDDLHNGVQIVDPPRRGRREQIVVEEDLPTPRQGSRGKKSSNSSPVKRKPVASGGRKKRK